MQPHYTVVLRYVPSSQFPTVWHPTAPTGPFSVLTRGAFATEEDAHEWAQANLRAEHEYEVRKIA